MKHLSVILGLVILFYSCKNSGTSYHPNKLDTFPQALYRIKFPNGLLSAPLLDTAILRISSKYVLLDSTKGTGGHWAVDSQYYGRIANDTLRDALRRPLYDYLHHPQWSYTYYLVQKEKFQPVTIKIH